MAGTALPHKGYSYYTPFHYRILYKLLSLYTKSIGARTKSIGARTKSTGLYTKSTSSPLLSILWHNSYHG